MISTVEGSVGQYPLLRVVLGDIPNSLHNNYLL